MFIILVSLTCTVTAADDDSIITDQQVNNAGNFDNMLKDTDKITTTNPKSDTSTFSKLNEQVNSGKDEINLTCDYTFNENYDKNLNSSISIINKSIVINGNNHKINALNKSGIFNIKFSNITINNLTIINGNNTAITVKNSTLTTNNVIFENNYAQKNGGVIYGENTTYTSCDDTFKNNYARFGSAVMLDKNSTLYMTRANFNTSIEMYWGLIELRNSKFSINNTRFHDMKSRYTTGIHAEECQGNISNCSFEKLKVTYSGGALGFKEFKNDIIIDNCTFNDVESKKNGGAIFIDVEGPETEINGHVIIKNSGFTDCASSYGGAILQLGGILDITNTTITRSNAIFDGGAIYTSYTNMTIKDSNIRDNTAYQNDYDTAGGAIYFDYGILNITNTNITNNNANLGGAIYLYDSQYNISDSYFKANKENIHSVFDQNKTTLSNNNFADGNNTLGLEEYIYVFESNPTSIDYNPLIFDESMINASRFDLRDYGLLTSIKDQGYMGSCWTFGTAAALESALLKATNRTVNMDISENNIQNTNLKYNILGTNTNEGHDQLLGGTYYLSWKGVVSYDNDNYDELGKVSPIIENGTKYHIHNLKLISSRENSSDTYKFKKALIEYGAIAVGVASPDRDSGDDYNNITHASYIKGNKTLQNDHVVTLIGWDDNYSKENFLITPPGDGAWIIRNSWSTDWGEDGYYYLSYYDSSGFKEGESIAYIINNNTELYDKNYQWDMSGAILFKSAPYKLPNIENMTPQEIKQTIKKLESENNKTVSYANSYESIDDELIAAIGTYFKYENQNYTFNIKVNDEVVLIQSGKSSFAGYETIKLDEYIPIKKDETFTINMTTKYIPESFSRQKTKANHSLYNNNGTWQAYDNSDEPNLYTVASLKAYTINDKSYIQTEKLDNQIKAVYYDAKGEKLENTLVYYKIEKSIINTTTDNNATIYIDTSSIYPINTITLVNPINKEEINITINNTQTTPTKEYTIIQNKQSANNNKVQKTKTQTSPYKILKDNKPINIGFTITLKTLQDIFKQQFINGHLIVYLDGQVIFNQTVTDDLSTIILEIIQNLIGEHEIRVEFTDSENITQNYTENIIIQ